MAGCSMPIMTVGTYGYHFFSDEPSSDDKWGLCEEVLGAFTVYHVARAARPRGQSDIVRLVESTPPHEPPSLPAPPPPKPSLIPSLMACIPSQIPCLPQPIVRVSIPRNTHTSHPCRRHPRPEEPPARNGILPRASSAIAHAPPASTPPAAWSLPSSARGVAAAALHAVDRAQHEPPGCGTPSSRSATRTAAAPRAASQTARPCSMTRRRGARHSPDLSAGPRGCVVL